jgi:hypothetical protein
MSAQDRRAEREVADHYNDDVRKPDKPRAPRSAKRFAESVLTGFAVTSVLKKIF